MTRGMYYQRMSDWAQNLAGINGATVDQNPDERETGSLYRVLYDSSEIVLEESKGSGGEIARILSGDLGTIEEIADEIGYQVEERDRSFPVLKY